MVYYISYVKFTFEHPLFLTSLNLGGKKKSIPFRRQRMEIDCAVPPPDGPIRQAFAAADDPYVADLLQVADSKIAELEKKVNIVCDEKEVLDRKLKSFKQQVKLSRERKIIRHIGIGI